MVVGAFAGLFDLVFALDTGAGDLLARLTDALTAFAGLFDLVLALSTGAGDLLGWRVGGFEGLFDLIGAFATGAGDLFARPDGAFAGLLLRAKVILTGEVWLPRLTALLTGLFDLEAARLVDLATLPEVTFSTDELDVDLPF